MRAEIFHSKLMSSLGRRKDIAVKKYELKYSKGEYDFLRIASRELGPKDKVILIRAGIHGDEIAGPLTILSFCNEIIDYIHRAGLKCIIYPLGNPVGFESGKRYCFRGTEGNNDFLRYELEDGKLTGDLSGGVSCKRWHWCSDPKLKIRLPQETRLMHKLLKKDPLSQIAAVIDLHQDCISNFGPCAYHYAFGDLARYKKIIGMIEEIVPILRNTEVDSGESYPEKSDGQGFVVRHDGTLPDLLFRLGVGHCITAETTRATPLETAKLVNILWIFGVAELAREGK